MNDKIIGSFVILSILLALGSLISFFVTISHNEDSPWLSFYIISPSKCGSTAFNISTQQIPSLAPSLSPSLTPSQAPSIAPSAVLSPPPSAAPSPPPSLLGSPTPKPTTSRRRRLSGSHTPAKWYLGITGFCPQHEANLTGSISRTCLTLTDRRWKVYDYLSVNESSRTYLSKGASLWYHQLGGSTNPFLSWVLITLLLPYVILLCLSLYSTMNESKYSYMLTFIVTLYLYALFTVFLAFGWVPLSKSPLVRKASYRHFFPGCQVSVTQSIAFRAYSASWVMSLMSLGFLFLVFVVYWFYETDDESSLFHPGYINIKQKLARDKSITHFLRLIIQCTRNVITNIPGLSSDNFSYYHVGDFVLYQWKGYYSWYEGSIFRCNPDGTYDVIDSIDEHVELNMYPKLLKLNTEEIVKNFIRNGACPSVSDEMPPVLRTGGAGVLTNETYNPLTNIEETNPKNDATGSHLDAAKTMKQVAPLSYEQILESNRRVFRAQQRR